MGNEVARQVGCVLEQPDPVGKEIVVAGHDELDVALLCRSHDGSALVPRNVVLVEVVERAGHGPLGQEIQHREIREGQKGRVLGCPFLDHANLVVDFHRLEGGHPNAGPGRGDGGVQPLEQRRVPVDAQAP